MDEVRDVEARRRLETTMLTTRLELRAPSKEALAKVIAFANATGDFAALSAADIKLIAVTRMIEVELNGEQNLRAAPVAQAQVFKRGGEEKEEEEEEEDVEEGGEEGEGDDDDEFYKGCVVHSLDDDEHVHAATVSDAVAAGDQPPLDLKGKKVDAPVAAAASAAATSGSGSKAASLPGWGDWVTDAAQLRGAAQPEISKDGAEEEGSSVACLTSDFAMQNVLLQMGLRVLSPDGRRITRVKQWALRCYTCTKITRNMTKQFCPHCGNCTLKRVSISVDAKGSIMAFFNPKNKISKRGSKFPVPKPVGGRAPVFITDECELPKTRPKNFRAEKLATEFAFGDARNRTAEKPKIGYGKSNPNASKKRVDKAKKSVKKMN